MTTFIKIKQAEVMLPTHIGECTTSSFLRKCFEDIFFFEKTSSLFSDDDDNNVVVILY